MLRRFLIAAAGAVALTAFTTTLSQISTPAYAGEKARQGRAVACEDGAREGAGNPQTRQGKQQAHPTFREGVRVAAGDVDGDTSDIRVRTRSPEPTEDQVGTTMGNIMIGTLNANCPPAARTPEERRLRPR
jgi:hypothetical protein